MTSVDTMLKFLVWKGFTLSHLADACLDFFAVEQTFAQCIGAVFGESHCNSITFMHSWMRLLVTCGFRGNSQAAPWQLFSLDSKIQKIQRIFEARNFWQRMREEPRKLFTFTKASTLGLQVHSRLSSHEDERELSGQRRRMILSLLSN